MLVLVANFNPRPLAGATWANGIRNRILAISIHAPLRGRPQYLAFGSKAAISIHAPLRGRRAVPAEPAHCRNFNPRPLAGATNLGGDFLEPEIFQSTPPCGGDAMPAQATMPEARFQSTPPCGGDCQTGQLECIKRFRLFSRKSVHGSPKPHFPVLVPSVCFPFALTAPWELLGHRSFWLPGAGFCSDTCFPGCRTASCRGLCR